MKKAFQNHIIDAILLDVLGTVLIIRPNGTLTFVCRLFSVVLLVMGGARLCWFLWGNEKRYVSSLLTYLFEIVIGIAILVNTKFFIGIVPYVGGAVILAGAAVNLVRLKRRGRSGRSEKATAALMCAAMVLGVIVILNPAAIAGIITRIMGFALVLVGVTMPFSPPEEME